MTPERKLLTSHLIEYTANTTVHGIKYLADTKRPVYERIFWLIIFVICSLFLGSFVLGIVQKFNSKSVILVEDEQPTHIHSIPFPAVTICPAIKIKTEFVSEKDAIKWFDGMDNSSMITDLAYLVCNEIVMRVLKPTNIKELLSINQSHIELLHQISPNLFNTIDSINFITETTSPFQQVEDLFSFILTNEGICFTFNTPSEIMRDEPSLQTEYKYHNIQTKTVSWDSDYGYTGYPRYPRTAWGNGPGKGLHLWLYGKKEDINTFCQPTQLGYKILLHTPDEYPTTVEKFISIPHNTMTQIKITPKITRTSNSLGKLKPEQRQCFFNYERNLKYFTFYNRANCKLECLANFTLQQFGCVHFSLPRQSGQRICNNKVPMDRFYNSEEGFNAFVRYKTKVAYEYGTVLDEYEPRSFKNISKFDCNCLPACNTVEYEYSVKVQDFDMDDILRKYYPAIRDNSSGIANTNLDIFFGVTKVTGTTRKEYYEFSDLISNIGGLVGLFTGASVISIFELIYYLIVRYG